ncbi:MAG: S-layer protein [uncultured bacterium]|nr:MAG: S-layer protein [uncultured bacterium]
MKFTLRSAPWSSVGIAFLFLFAVGIGLSFQYFGLASTLSVDESEESEYLIDPDRAEINIAESYTFSSYTETTTQSIPTDSEWHVERTSENGEIETNPTDIYLEGCLDSVDCTVHAGTIPGTVTVVAEHKDKTATATLTINEDVSEETPFMDTLPDWATNSIKLLSDRGIMKGYADGTFGAGDPVTRGQFTLLMHRIMKMAYPEIPDIMGDCGVYGDVLPDHYAYDAICFGYYGDWFKNMAGMDGENFKPDEALLRKDAALILANTLLANLWNNYYAPLLYGNINPATIDFLILAYQDVLDQQNAYFRPIAIVTYFGIMTGTEVTIERGDPYYDSYERLYFYPGNSINRAETAMIFARFILDLDL